MRQYTAAIKMVTRKKARPIVRPWIERSQGSTIHRQSGMSLQPAVRGSKIFSIICDAHCDRRGKRKDELYPKPAPRMRDGR